MHGERFARNAKVRSGSILLKIPGNIGSETGKIVSRQIDVDFAMMGRKGSDQGQFFYAFNLEDHVPKDHLLRGIDRFLDLSDLHAHLAPYYSHTGRPSIDPELMIRMLIVGYCFGIRSERRLCEEVTLNLAYRWFCRLSIEDAVPDHSTFSKNRHGRFRDAEAFRFVFEQVLQR